MTGSDVVKSDKGVAVSDLAKLGKDDDHAMAANPNNGAADSGKALGAAAFKSAIRARLGAKNP